MQDHAGKRHRPQSKAPGWQRVLGTLLASILIFCAAFPVWAESIDHVVFVSIDGLRGDLLRDLINNDPLAYPNFKRLVNEGASTFNARSDYDYTETLQNHATLATGRGVTGPTGHNWTGSSDPSSSQTVPTNKSPCVSSVGDVAHDNRLSTSLYAGKGKLVGLLACAGRKRPTRS
jgi:hypothetical protein